MIAVTAAGGVLHRQKENNTEVLLIFRNGVWDLPKGKREENESIAHCARREVAEETGAARPDIEDFLVKTHHRYSREGKKYAKDTHWYKMKISSTRDLSPQQEEGIEKLKWVELKKATEMVGYSNLVKVLDSL